MYTSITCTFVNQPRNTIKSCRVKYGPGNGNDCAKRELSSHVEGTILNANSISLEIHNLTDDGSICFSIEASNGTKIVNVVGSYDTG